MWPSDVYKTIPSEGVPISEWNCILWSSIVSGVVFKISKEGRNRWQARYTSTLALLTNLFATDPETVSTSWKLALMDFWLEWLTALLNIDVGERSKSRVLAAVGHYILTGPGYRPQPAKKICRASSATHQNTSKLPTGPRRSSCMLSCGHSSTISIRRTKNKLLFWPLSDGFCNATSVLRIFWTRLRESCGCWVTETSHSNVPFSLCATWCDATWHYHLRRRFQFKYRCTAVWKSIR